MFTPLNYVYTRSIYEWIRLSNLLVGYNVARRGPRSGHRISFAMPGKVKGQAIFHESEKCLPLNLNCLPLNGGARAGR